MTKTQAKSDRTIFVVGNSRSGTTMLGRMLNRCEGIHTFQELHFFEQMVDAKTVRDRPEWSEAALTSMLERLLTSSREGLFTPVSPQRYGPDAARILKQTPERDPISVYEAFLRFETVRAGMEIPCEQTPRYLYQAEEILEAFPEARMICMVRDPRSVLLSQKNKWRRRMLGASNMPRIWAFRAWANYSPYTMSWMWVSASRRARRFRDHPRFHVVRFEDLMVRPEEILHEMCTFLGMDYDPKMLEIAQVGSSTGQDRPDRTGLDTSRVENWRGGGLDPVEISLCERLAKAEMAEWGYVPSDATASLPARATTALTFAGKSSIALVMNIRRSKNIAETIRRRLF